MRFSCLDRNLMLSRLNSEYFDLLIIGGGITGAGIALDAASRGLKTALIEKNDFAFGTSSRSTKLIHGGLRYLKQLEFGLVREVGSERAIVHRLAPHLVIPEKMLLPLQEKKGLGYWLTSIGLMIYDWLAGVKPKDQRRMLNRRRTLKSEPLLLPDGIKGGAVYAEYRTDDARLTIEIVKKAVEHGALCINYATANEFVYNEGNIAGVKVIDEISGRIFQVNAKAVVNATGPWVDTLRELNKSKNGKRLHLTKGVHVVVPRERLPIRQSIYFDVDDGRMIFAIPRGRTTYIGTTDTNYEGSIDEVYTDRHDVNYLIKAVNATFPSVNLSITDIESSWAGLRPLIHEEGKSASQLSRKDEIFESTSGLISIAGGKLTGYRKMSERVVDLVLKKFFHDRKFVRSSSQKIKLGGNEFKSAKRVNRYIERLDDKISEAGLPLHMTSYLVHNYGTQTESILKRFDGLKNGDSDFRLLQAEFEFTIEHECVCSLTDFFIRRTGLVYFNIDRVLKNYQPLSSVAKFLLGWTDERCGKEVKLLTDYISKIRNFA